MQYEAIMTSQHTTTHIYITQRASTCSHQFKMGAPAIRGGLITHKSKEPSVHPDTNGKRGRCTVVLISVLLVHLPLVGCCCFIECILFVLVHWYFVLFFLSFYRVFCFIECCCCAHIHNWCICTLKSLQIAEHGLNLNRS